MNKLLSAVLATTLIAAGTLTAQEKRKSPHETVSATVAGKTISISYGRPYLKGRKAVGGALVPYGQVWRMGADEATKLTTDTDLMIGDLKVPKGSYSLFILAEKDKWTLIVNKTADQWGAFNYNQSQDLGRVPMRTNSSPSPAEQFTITLAEAQNMVTLHLAWENVEASVPIKVAE